nr:HAD family acid phosphatase [Sphingomonas japonica]
MQYLYGSGEAAALSLQSYMALANFLIARSSDREIGHDVPSVVLAPGSTLAAPRFVPCGDKPLALVLDVDETALLNLGYEQDEARRGTGYDPLRWDRWEKTGTRGVAPVPGALEAIAVARRADIAVVFNSNRSNANASQTAAAIAGAGLGTPVHLDTLWLKGDAGPGSGKDARRARIADKYCVIAMVGDQLGDFSDLFNAPGTGLAARRAAIQGRELEILWGQGWFMLPNPVYGTGLQGGYDDVFPADKRWADPAGGQ